MSANKEKNYINKQITIMVGFKIDFKNIINNIDSTLQRVFLFITDVEE